MRFKEISYLGGKVRICTEIQISEDEFLEQRLVSEDEPRESFNECLQALTKFVLAICDLETDYDKNMSILAVKYGYTNGSNIKGAVIVAQKALETAPSQMAIRTPYLPEWPVNEMSHFSMPLGMPEALTRLENEAKDYLEGRRFCEQPSLFPEGSDFRFKVQMKGASTITGAPPLITDPFVEASLLDEIESRGY